ncbi:MAG: helix-turn-helix domain-containing protein [Planctomycetes bacterium]|nr:helix-turn-helix domain-containing protein [Planctomycetota bacterium]
MLPDNAGHCREADILAPKQEAAALALACGDSEPEAAREAGCSERTIRNWLHEPAFTRRIADLRSEMTSRALGKLVDNMVSAADTLGYLCRRGKSEQVRLGAARALLELGVKMRETVELEQRMAALEANQRPAGRRIA